MKYFTKEWYQTCQKTSFHLSLEEDKQAETFSEEYFHQLYDQKLKEWLSFMEQMPPELIEESMSEAEILSQQVFYATDHEEVENFHNIFMDNQERIQKTLPEAILKIIADIRVFVLDKASSEVIAAVTQYCEDNMRSVKRAIEQYQKHLKNVSNSFQRNILEKHNFHDCKVTGIKRTEDSLLILLDSGGFTEIKEVLFEIYKIIKQDSLLENSWWLYDEIYDVDGRYEWHVLLQDENLELADFIISAENITFSH
ncbi:DUF4085 family protein [Desulfosporosinus meridiei]|uniref:DUF4085 family protein n=1 Tax=Desulfosporosinus meridiei (strain ATCC BAA-275 / DSM 13257 / KCTC 12902 / NCIMB 13706 / S10) TaxID=768704 RepID=J7INW6_DESMD|nr:DUF4085 family protein [Desulfosporosinus meridiei]AFQ43542.1 hypothetical protein Desmer_1551 [Desulfosporosinus meridiei DSM 13257]